MGDITSTDNVQESYVVMGVVQAVRPANHAGFGSASTFSYDLMVAMPGGSIPFNNIIPSAQRYVDGVNVIPFEVGKPVPVSVSGTRWSGYVCHILIAELLHIVPCGGTQ